MTERVDPVCNTHHEDVRFAPPPSAIQLARILFPLDLFESGREIVERIGHGAVIVPDFVTSASSSGELRVIASYKASTAPTSRSRPRPASPRPSAPSHRSAQEPAAVRASRPRFARHARPPAPARAGVGRYRGVPRKARGVPPCRYSAFPQESRRERGQHRRCARRARRGRLPAVPAAQPPAWLSNQARRSRCCDLLHNGGAEQLPASKCSILG